MIRQDEFIDIALQRALCFLKEDPFTGELFLYLSRMAPKLLINYLSEMRDITIDLLKKGPTHKWSCQEEWEKIKEAADTMLRMLE